MKTHEDKQKGSLDVNVDYEKIAKEFKEVEECMSKTKQYFLLAEYGMMKIKNLLELAVLKKED